MKLKLKKKTKLVLGVSLIALAALYALGKMGGA